MSIFECVFLSLMYLITISALYFNLHCLWICRLVACPLPIIFHSTTVAANQSQTQCSHWRLWFCIADMVRRQLYAVHVLCTLTPLWNCGGTTSVHFGGFAAQHPAVWWQWSELWEHQSLLQIIVLRRWQHSDHCYRLLRSLCDHTDSSHRFQSPLLHILQRNTIRCGAMVI